MLKTGRLRARLSRLALVSCAPICTMGLGCGLSVECVETDSNVETVLQEPGPVFVGTQDVYARGALDVSTTNLAPCEQGAPVPLRILAPTPNGAYAVVVFQHGFLASNRMFDEILTHLASHGFVVVVPQMYLPTIGPLFGGPTSQQEAELAAVVLAWVRANLDQAVDVLADAARLGLAGHSRGGKVVWQMLSADSSGVMGVAGIEPTDGMGILFGVEPRAITGPFDFPFPSFVLGAGRGGFCSPDGDNHVQYYQASAPPAWHVVAPNMGHADMLDEGEADLASAVCPAGEDRLGARTLTAGLLTAFFRATLQGDESAFAILTDTDRAPIEIAVESK